MKSNQTSIITSLLFVFFFFSFLITIAYSNALTSTEQSHNASGYKPAQDHACLVFEPPYRTVMVGDIFTLSIQVQADSHQVDGVAAYVDFDRSRLQVEEMTLTSDLPLILEEEFSNSTGTIDLAAGAISNYPTGTFEFAEIELAAIVSTPLSSVPLNFTPPRQSDITFGGDSILGCHTDANIAILIPTATLSHSPTTFPTAAPSKTPTAFPTATPSKTPTAFPTAILSTPSNTPTAIIKATSTPSTTIDTTNTPTTITRATSTLTNTPIISTQTEFFLPIILKRVE